MEIVPKRCQHDYRWHLSWNYGYDIRRIKVKTMKIQNLRLNYQNKDEASCKLPSLYNTSQEQVQRTKFWCRKRVEQQSFFAAILLLHNLDLTNHIFINIHQYPSGCFPNFFFKNRKIGKKVFANWFIAVYTRKEKDWRPIFRCERGSSNIRFEHCLARFWSDLIESLQI